MNPRGRATSMSPARSAAQLANEIQLEADALTADVRELAGAPPAAKPKRRQPRALTQAQLVNKLLKLVGPSRSARSSIKLARGPRGQTLVEVLIHVGDEAGLTTVEAVEAKARAVYDRLCSEYPLAGMNGAGPDES